MSDAKILGHYGQTGIVAFSHIQRKFKLQVDFETETGYHGVASASDWNAGYRAVQDGEPTRLAGTCQMLPNDGEFMSAH